MEIIPHVIHHKQNDTMRIIYMYHSAEPRLGSILPGSLPSPQSAYRGYVPLSLTQRVHGAPAVSAAAAAAAAALTMSAAADAVATPPVDPTFWLELRHEDVELPAPDETHFWCKVFELSDFRQRHHLIRVGLHTDDMISSVRFVHTM